MADRGEQKGGLPWYCIWTDFSDHGKTHELCALVDDDNAGMHVIRLLEHCAEQALDGVVKESIVEGVARWKGRRGVLLAALKTAGFLEPRENGTVEVHGWVERNGARIAKWLRDNAKPRGNKALPSPVPHGTSKGPTRDQQGTDAGAPAGPVTEDGRQKTKQKLARSPRAARGGAEDLGPAPASFGAGPAQSPGVGGGNRTDPQEDAAQANAAAPEGSAPAARDRGDAGAGGIPAKLGAPGPAPSTAADPEPGQGARPTCPVTPSSSRGVRSVAVDEDRPAPRPLRLANLVDQPLVAELRDRVARAVGHGIVVAKAGEEAAVAREIEEILAVQTVEQAFRFVLTTARRQGVDVGSLTWCLTVLRDMPPPEQLRAPANASRWDAVVAAMTPEQREDFEAEKAQAFADVQALLVWNSEANRLLDAAEERLWAKWNPRVGRPVAAAGGA